MGPSCRLNLYLSLLSSGVRLVSLQGNPQRDTAVRTGVPEAEKRRRIIGFRFSQEEQTGEGGLLLLFTTG